MQSSDTAQIIDVEMKTEINEKEIKDPKEAITVTNIDENIDQQISSLSRLSFGLPKE